MILKTFWKTLLKAEEFQIAKNKLRSGKAKWNDKKVNKAINGMM